VPHLSSTIAEGCGLQVWMNLGTGKKKVHADLLLAGSSAWGSDHVQKVFHKKFILEFG
jgi:hypothetical protein